MSSDASDSPDGVTALSAAAGADPAPDLAELLKLSGRGDEAAFAQLYDATAARAFGLAVRVVRDPAQAEEVAQEAFLEIWRTASRFDQDKGSAVSWILTLVHRKAVDRVRSAEASTRRDTTYHQSNDTVEHDSTAEAAQASMEARRVRQAHGLTDRGPARSAGARLFQGLHAHGGRHDARPAGGYGQDTDQGRPDPSPRHDGGRTVNGVTCTHCPVPTSSTRSTTTSARPSRQHLPGCLDCQAEVASLREAAALMADDAAMTPPASLRASVLAGISTDPSAPARGRARPSTPRSRRPPTWCRCAGVDFGWPRSSPRPPSRPPSRSGVTWQPWDDQTTRPRSRPPTRCWPPRDAQKVSIDFKDGSSASVYRSKSKGKAVILTDGMAAPPSGKVYELWLQRLRRARWCRPG